jgi:hypothetical protein
MNRDIGHPRGDFMPWLGHQPLCRHQVSKSERDQCLGWVGTSPASPASPSFDGQVAYSAFAVGVIANVYGRFFRGNAFAVMVGIDLFDVVLDLAS